MTTATQQPDYGLLVFCGVFAWQPGKEKLPMEKKWNMVDWWEQIGVFSHNFFRNNYYPTYANVAISPSCFAGLLPDVQPQENQFRHLRTPKEEFSLSFTLTVKEQKISLVINRLDVYLYPDSVGLNQKERLGIFAFYIQLPEEYLRHEIVSDITNLMRNLSSSFKSILQGNEQFTMLEWLEKELLGCKLSNTYLDIFSGSKLKTYTVLGYVEDALPDDYLQLEIAGCIPIDSHTNNGLYAFDKDYAHRLLQENTLQTFPSWKVLALLDTFSVFIKKIYKDSKTPGWNLKSIEDNWAETYFLIYVHCLHQKFVLFKTQTELANPGLLKRYSSEIRDEFIRQMSRYHFSHISYNFLSNLLYQKIKQGMEIPEEIALIDDKVQRIHNLAEEQRSRKIQYLLVALAVFGLFSVLNDSTEFFKTITNDNFSYRKIAVISLSGLITLIACLLLAWRYFTRPTPKN